MVTGLGIYDTMQYINSPVSTLCIGQASSMGSFLLAAGEKGKDIPYRILELWFISHQQDFGQATDIQIHARGILSLKERLNGIYSKHTGKSLKKFQRHWKEIIL